jgi:DNA-binding NtrC family response regulator
MLFAQAPAMRSVIESVKAAAAVSGGVCITGEQGTGRELIARSIHGLVHPDAHAPFVALDCRDVPRSELEPRLFGLPAARASAGRANGLERVGSGGAIAQARGGTLYLAGLLDAPSAVQAKLARLLRDGEATLDDSSIELDFRPIAAFEPGVDAAVADGRLRGDLFDRLVQVRIDVPPLRRRRQDIPLLAVHMLEDIAVVDAQPPRLLSRSALALLSAMPWTGNAGELRTLLETVARAVAKPIIDIDDLLEHASLDGTPNRIEEGTTLRDARTRFERDCISAVLMRHHGRVNEAAKALGIQRTNLYRKVRQLNVSRSLLVTRR